MLNNSRAHAPGYVTLQLAPNLIRIDHILWIFEFDADRREVRGLKYEEDIDEKLTEFPKRESQIEMNNLVGNRMKIEGKKKVTYRLLEKEIHEEQNGYGMVILWQI